MWDLTCPEKLDDITSAGDPGRKFRMSTAFGHQGQPDFWRRACQLTGCFSNQGTYLAAPKNKPKSIFLNREEASNGHATDVTADMLRASMGLL